MNTIIPWLEHLNVLMRPRNIALVGAGNGKGIWAQWLAHQASESRVTFIEAEPLQYSTLQRTLDLLGERAQHCEIRNTVVAAQQGTASFFVANSQQESGLLEPRSLLSLWPNLRTEEVKELNAITLDALFSDLSEDAEQPMGEGHWLLIDCLPAGALLRASSKLDLVDVVVARVLLGEMHAMPDGTSLEEVAEFLQQKGMVQIAVEATRHPGIGYALFVRDARAALHVHHSECQKLRLNGEEQARLLQEFQTQIEHLTQAKLIVETQSQERVLQLEQLRKGCDEQAKLAQELQAQVVQLTQGKAAADKQLQERAQQLEQVTKARDEQAKLAQERLAQTEQLTQAKAATEKQLQERAQQLEQVTKARDEQAKLAQERQAQVEQLTQAKAAGDKQLQERAQQLVQVTKARDEQTQLAQERLAQTEQLTQAKAAAEKQSQERAQQLEQVTKARDEQAKLAQKLQVQIEQLQAQVVLKADLQAMIKHQNDELARSLEILSNSLKDEVNNATRQINSFTGLENYWQTGDLPAVNTERHSWPVSPDFSLYVVGLIEQKKYDLIIEFGSGISTLVVAKTLAKMESRCKSQSSTVFVSFDHLEQYYNQTLNILRQSGLENNVELHLSPLRKWMASNGKEYSYYDCQEVLAGLAQRYYKNKINVLVIVDGPPASTGVHARYPAAPLVLQNFSGMNIDFLMDDYIRLDEKEIVKLWQAEMNEVNINHSSFIRKLEKDACLLQVLPN
ncbi:class I SAM-dependent methyltransferase [Comamonas thiooxydans]|uniref:class I SAM-dependent methyltransferase n=1 Tax=Comamonas thiooxydans TaxID=363952 RepID=UPI00070D2FE9|nr:class I SAM-dependent methyltransferase [Comamonas thiooxydans]